MKPMISKIILLLILAVSLSVAAWPAQSLAIDRNPTATATEKNQTAFCNQLTTISDRITGRMTEKESRINNRQDIRLTNLADKRGERIQKRTENRAYWDSIRAAKYTVLEAKAKTDEQKQAVVAFKDTIETAIKTRRDTIDAAIAQFKKDLDSLIATRQSSVDQAVARYKNSVNTAIAKAQSDCSSATVPSTVRTELKNSLLAARTTLQSDRATIDKVADNIDSLITARKVAVDAARTVYRTSHQTAADILKQAFKTS